MFKDKDEFKIVFNNNYNALCNYAFSYLNNHELSEDAVQEVFVHIWQNRDHLTKEVDIVPYLFTSVKHKALEIIRKHDLEINKMRALSDYKKSNESEDSNLDHKKFLMLESLNNSIRQLPDKCRDIFVLSKVNGLTYSEIADLRNLSKKTVENHISNALKILRNKLRKQ
jgi:RNA polymerase sigma-70 factor (ECF subfamily)